MIMIHGLLYIQDGTLMWRQVDFYNWSLYPTSGNEDIGSGVGQSFDPRLHMLSLPTLIKLTGHWIEYNRLCYRMAELSTLTVTSIQPIPSKRTTRFFISNTFISNSRLKFANFQNLSRKILRTEVWNICQMIAFFPNSILNTFSLL